MACRFDVKRLALCIIGSAVIMCAKQAGVQPGSRQFVPAYLGLHRSGELKQRADSLWQMMESCRLCPRGCGVNRLKGEKGFCRADARLMVSSYSPHFGEERPLVGRHGSGTVFFANCGLRCVFCINWQISQEGEGDDRSVDELAGMMLALQKAGCHNINVVTPTHYSPHILKALDIAAGKGLRLPLVWNTCGYERLEALGLLDGVVDIYLPDFKYADTAMAAIHLRGAKDYTEVTTAALLEMNRQVGVARPDEDGLIRRGLMVRHLVMPNNAARTDRVMAWLGENLPKETYVNVMAQYTPFYQANRYPEIARRITPEEYRQAVRWAKEAGLTNLDVGR